MKKRMTALALLLCLLLTACGGKEVDSQGQMSFWEEASGLPEDMVILTVDGREIPAWRYLYWLKCACDNAYAQYESTGMELDWMAKVDGRTLAEYVKEQALADTALYATVENWAETYGCTLTEEDRQRSAEPAAEGLDMSQAAELQNVGLLYGKLNRLCRAGENALTPNAAELAAFAKKTGKVTVDRMLFAAGEDREAARHRAEESFSKLNNAEDQMIVFETLVTESDDTAGPRTITLGDGTWDETLEQVAVALAEGQFSGILESEEGFSILKRLPPDREFLLDAYFDDLLQTAAQNALVCHTQEYAELDVEDFATRLNELRDGANYR